MRQIKRWIRSFFINRPKYWCYQCNGCATECQCFVWERTENKTVRKEVKIKVKSLSALGLDGNKPLTPMPAVFEYEEVEIKNGD